MSSRLLVVVAGSRGFMDYAFVRSKLDALFVRRNPSDIVIVSGNCPNSPDVLGERYATEHKKDGMGLIVCAANWKNEDGSTDRAAGHKRNEVMAAIGDCLVAFWDGKSSGTRDMIESAERYGLSIRVYKVEKSEHNDRVREAV